MTATSTLGSVTSLATALAGELRYSTVWEDHLLLEHALAIRSDDDVLVIASAGCNVLNLLLRAPRRIVALDFNPAQTALLELKLAALGTLQYGELLALLGIEPTADVLALYARARHRLSTSARDWWDAHPELIENGIESAGRLERYIDGFRRDHLLRIHRKETLAELFTLDDRSARIRYANEVLFTPELMRAFRGYFTRETLAARGRSPDQLRYVELVDVAEWFLGRLRWACTELPTRGNLYLERFFFGSARTQATLPPYLRADSFPALRALASRVEVVTGDLGEFLGAQHAGSLSKAALSDVFEYLSPDESGALFDRLAAVVRPGGRLAYWNLFVSRERPLSLARSLRPNEALARSLAARDRAWFYSAFHVEDVCAA